MVIKNMIDNFKKDTTDFISPDTLIERFRRVRALNAKPSDIGITQYRRKTFVTMENSGNAKRR